MVEANPDEYRVQKHVEETKVQAAAGEVPIFDEEVKADTSNLPNTEWIGIDLGTTTTCVAHWQEGENGTGRVDVIQDSEGHYTTPSVVAFRDFSNFLIGKQGEHLFTTHPSSVLFDSKRLIGRPFNSPEI